MDNDDDDDDEEEEIPLDLEEVEAVSKKARQDEEIHSEHMQVSRALGRFFILMKGLGKI